MRWVLTVMSSGWPRIVIPRKERVSKLQGGSLFNRTLYSNVGELALVATNTSPCTLADAGATVRSYYLKMTSLGDLAPATG